MRFIFSLILLFSTIVQSEPFTKRVHITTGQWPPYIDQSKEHQGCVASLIKDVFALYDIETRFVFMPWERAYQDGMKPEFIGSAYWYFSEQRSEDYIYTKHAITQEVSRFYHLKSLPLKYQTYMDLKPYILLLNKGLTYPESLHKAIEKHNIRTIEATYTDKNFPLIIRKRADVMIMDENTAKVYKQSLSASQKAALVTQKTPAYVKRGFLLINKQNKHYAELFNQGLYTLWKDEVYTRRYEQECSKIKALP
ncbi:polar amino acid transport system substrate-binding protein [Pseudoalteromonas citrea]|uniref:Polar amino acid transport system substrate-binding protein n=2 Tax=Pseudoalteromonas citrea TaxID=43655 RepID=A0AAD4AJW5_9GAMM|nr:transporter substrate-binding domain-containing protein [Pseudoalteromonas citrea]KAF7772453.1 polar amino acid transport system substrate-binding protein [Pseudoalteromonas citrea]